MFPSMEPVKRVSISGQVEIGARGRSFKGSIITTRVGSDGLTLSLIEARKREGLDCFGTYALAHFLFHESLKLFCIIWLHFS